MAKLSRVDWDIIESRVRSIQTKHRLRNASAGLLWLVLEQFFPAAQDELLEVITDGPDDRGIDAVYVVESEGHAEVFLFQAKYREVISTTDKTINDASALSLRLFLEELFDRSGHLAVCGNFRLREAITDLGSARSWCDL